jgi:ABC-type uncharacterized transport system ATPase subunit
MNIISKLQSRIDRRSSVIRNYEYSNKYEKALFNDYMAKNNGYKAVLERLRILQKTDKEALATILWQARQNRGLIKMLHMCDANIVYLDEQL